MKWANVKDKDEEMKISWLYLRLSNKSKKKWSKKVSTWIPLLYLIICMYLIFETMVKGKYLLNYILWWRKSFFPISSYESLWFVKRKEQIYKGQKRKFLTSSTFICLMFTSLFQNFHFYLLRFIWKKKNKIL